MQIIQCAWVKKNVFGPSKILSLKLEKFQKLKTADLQIPSSFRDSIVIVVINHKLNIRKLTQL